MITRLTVIVGSSRRRKPSMPAPQPSTRTRLRPRARVTESELQTADSDNETKEILPGTSDERTSSPFDSGNVKRRDGAQVLLCSLTSVRIITVGKRKASFVDSVDSPQDKKRLRGDSEPAEEEELGIYIHHVYPPPFSDSLSKDLPLITPVHVPLATHREQKNKWHSNVSKM